MKRLSTYRFIAIAVASAGCAWLTPRWMASYRMLWTDGDIPSPWMTLNVHNYPLAPWITVGALALLCLIAGLLRKVSELKLMHAVIVLLALVAVLLLRQVLAFSDSFAAMLKMK